MPEPRNILGALGRVGKLIAEEASPQDLVIDSRYELRSLIARGGMGEVFLARDARLNRTVALKMLAANVSGKEISERFQREARTLTHLEHPSIVPIYDFGTLPDGRLYYTMKYVTGRTFEEQMRLNFTRDELLRVLCEVCDAVQYAHDHGVIHRDLKPANIMIDGGGRVYVLDWGVAKLADEIQHQASRASGQVGSITLAGHVMGTLQYMSPEQARGDVATIGPATDIYSLGAILYQIITGRLPIDGMNTQGLINAAVQAAAPTPRMIDPSLPADLEAICTRAMHPHPYQRYVSARALREDIQRFLTGEPVLARQASSVRRLWTRAVRHRRYVFPVGTLLAIGLAAGLWLAVSVVQNQWRVRDRLAAAGRSRELAAREPASEREHLTRARDALVEALALAPGLDAAEEMLASVNDRLATLEKRAAEERAKLEAAQAQAALILEKSQLASRVFARWSRLQGTLRALETIYYNSSVPLEGRRAHAAAHWTEVEKFMRDTPADSASQATMKALAGWARVRAGYPEEGLVLMKQAALADAALPYGRLFETMARLAEHVERQPLPVVSLGARGLSVRSRAVEAAEGAQLQDLAALLEEVKQAPVWGKESAADFAHAIEAFQAWSAGDFAKARGSLTKALEAPDLRALETTLLLARARASFLTSEFEAGLADLAALAEIRRENADVLYYLGMLRLGLAMQRADAGDALREAIAAFDEVLERHPALTKALIGRAGARSEEGDARLEEGADARASFERAVADYTKALKLDAASQAARTGRGQAYAKLAKIEGDLGRDPRELYDRAIADFDEALAADETQFLARLARGATYGQRAEWEMRRGYSPEPSLDRAAADLDRVVEKSPEDASARQVRGLLYCRRGDAAQRAGAEAKSWYERAVEDFDVSIRSSPEFAGGYLSRGGAFYSLAHDAAARGDNPRDHFLRSIVDFEEAMRRNPRLVGAFLNRGLAWAGLAEHEHAAGQDATPSAQRAIEDLSAAIQRGRSTAARLARANAYALLGRVEAARSLDASAWYERAAADFRTVRETLPNHPSAARDAGIMHLRWAEAQAARGQDPREQVDHAMEALRRSVELNANDPVARHALGTVWLRQAEIEVATGRDGAAALHQALEHLNASLRLNANLWQSHLMLGQVFEKLGDREKAIRAYESVLRLRPSFALARERLRALREGPPEEE